MDAPGTETTPKMDRKLRAKWLRALRSGKIKQARGALINDDGAMCCIGVLGHICGMEDRELRRHAGSIWGTGLDPIIKALPHRESLEHLADMNDGQQKFKRCRSFKQIAAWIEKNL